MSSKQTVGAPALQPLARRVCILRAVCLLRWGASPGSKMLLFSLVFAHPCLMYFSASYREHRPWPDHAWLSPDHKPGLGGAGHVSLSR